MSEIEITTRPGAVSGAPGPAPERPRVELVLSPESGTETRFVEGSKAPSREQSIARARERAAKEGRSARAGGEDPNAAGSGDEGAEADDEETENEEGAEAEGEETSEESEADGEQAEGEEASEEEGEEEEADGEEEAAPAAAKKPAAKKHAEADADAEEAVLLAARIEADRVAIENEQLRQRVGLLEAGLLGEDARSAYQLDPAKYIREHVAALFALPVDDEDLGEELHGLVTDLTIAISGGQISSDKLAQAKHDRTSRAWRLDQKSRQATKKATPASDSRTEVENYIDSVVYKAASDRFPFIALAADLDGLTPGKAVAATMSRAVTDGRIRDADRKKPAEVLTEALRLTNHSYKARYEKIVARAATLGTAPAPNASGGGQPKPGAPKPESSANPKGKKPRTLSAAEAAAAPSKKPGQPAKKPEGPKEIIVVRDPDADEARRARIFAKHRKKP